MKLIIYQFQVYSKLTILIVILNLFSITTYGQKNQSPNILIMMADDWNWPHLPGIEEPNIKTPTFDWLREEGVTFQNAFVDSPSCTPSRAALLTGRHPWELETGVNLWGALPAKFEVYPDLLEEAGYTTGYSGKGWGPGRLEETGRSRNPAAATKYKNFEEFYAVKDPSKPFSFWFNTGDPHRPYEWKSGIRSGKKTKNVVVPPIWPDTENVRIDLLDYFTEVERYDTWCGKIIEFLRDQGELDNTIIIMTGDNGMPFPRAKMTLYDLGTHVPLAIRWPGTIEKGRVVTDMVSLSDLAPTFLEIAGVQTPKSMSSSSLLQILTSKKSGLIEPDRTQVFSSLEQHCGRYPRRAIQTHDYLFIRNYETERPINLCRAYWEGDKGYSPTWLELKELDPQSEMFQRVDGPLPEEELYSLKDDPYQLNNLASDPAFSKKKNELRNRLEKEQNDTKDPRVLGTYEAVFYPK